MANLSSTQLQAVLPVAMVLTAAKRLLLIDRGAFPPAPAAPQLIELNASGPIGSAPVFVAKRPITNLVEPLAALVLQTGSIVVTDARDQTTATPGDLVVVDPATGAGTRLLATLPASANPLVCPRALVRESDTRFVVADVGLKPFRSLPGAYVKVAEPAALYRVDRSGAVPTVERVSESGRLVYPTGLVQTQGVTYVADRGDYSDPAWGGPVTRVWRLGASELGVVVHFCDQRQASPAERRRIVSDIADIVASERPAQMTWTLVYQI